LIEARRRKSGGIPEALGPFERKKTRGLSVGGSEGGGDGK